MNKYRVLPGCEWVRAAELGGNVLAGEVVELPEHEAAPFLGRVLETVEELTDEPKTSKKK